MEIDKNIKAEYDLVYAVDIEEILILCFLECGVRRMN